MPWLLLVAAAVGILAAWLIHLFMRWNMGPPCSAGALLPPGSRGLPLLGETLEFFARNPSLELVPFLKRRLDRIRDMQDT
ncbi:hypothetical protein TRIUR3_24061 [Triticum urartu]|uniref:Uncharacterized protein n=1 Tax=Triticum urartu TaxID=4572 RepID=M7Z4U5_TRIUA|nr:hypothetical protein TRIUR3_24061 [Triticum urartu]